jgi:formylglycine-generating enzyme required for sulfatase activity
VGTSLLLLALSPRVTTVAAPAPPAGHPSYVETILGSRVRFTMVAVPGRAFRMGSPPAEKGRAEDEGPQHRVSLGPFWIGKTEVTWDEYDLFRRSKPVVKKGQKPPPGGAGIDVFTLPSPSYIDEYRGFGKKGYPVVGISHHAAMEYCRWLSAKTGKAYRLPTEAEWEYACRAGTTTAYTWGDGPDKLGDYAWYEKNSKDTTHPVGNLKPNPWGLHDMYGNVAEWCLDHYQHDYYRGFPPDKLALGPVKLPTANRSPHVARGGSWADAADRCRSAARRASDKSWNRSDYDRKPSIWWLADADFVGFRVARAVNEQANLKGLRSKVTRESK